MKIVFIIYIISWLILLAAYISSRFSKKEKSSFEEKTPWYVYVAMVVLAPLAAVLTPYFLYEIYRDNKKEKKRKAEREAKEKAATEKKRAAMNAYNSAKTIEANYASVGKDLHKLAKHEQYDAFLSCLDKISLHIGDKLLVEECNPKTGDIGDESTVYIQLANGEADENIFGHLIVEHSPMGAWQATLLHTLWHALPLFWHGNYHARDYIFTKEDANNISAYNNEDNAGIIKMITKFDCSPEVREKDDKYYVSCCFFSNFKGLVREYYELTFNENKVTDIFHIANKTLFEYNCGILF